MRFDLLSNPFAILGLADSVDQNAVSARARELATPEAAAASRLLLVPRTRLQAELGYLPGASSAIAQGCLRVLSGGGEPDLQVLTPLARANLLAHLAAHQKAAPTHLRDLVNLQDAIRDSAHKTTSAAREHARMAPVPNEMLENALEELAGQHAEAFCEGVLCLPSGADLFAELVQAFGAGANARGSFLRQASAAWERATASESTRSLEEAESLETALREKANENLARKLAAVILRFAARTRPRREACRGMGLSHELSVEAHRRWRSVALDLNNGQDAVPEAIIIFDALVSGFGTGDEIGAASSRDLEVCRERLAAGEGTPEWRRLVAAVEASQSAHKAFGTCDHDSIEAPTSATPRVVKELVEAFVAAARVATTDWPWRMLRAFTLRLHNDFSATAAALAFTELSIKRASETSAAADILKHLQRDSGFLRRQRLRTDLSSAMQSGKQSTVRQLLCQLIPLTDDPEEKSNYEKALLEINRRRRTAQLKGAFYAVLAIAGIAFFGLRLNNSRRSPIARLRQIRQVIASKTRTATVSQRPALTRTPQDLSYSLPQLQALCRGPSSAGANINDSGGTRRGHISKSGDRFRA